jgi:3-deoxy-D-manno-octulosonic-acid transferase
VRPLYNLLTWFLLIPYTTYWLARAVVNPSYRPGLPQRFGFGYPALDKSIWIHAVSVGEVVAAAPLVRALLREYPQHRLVMTTVTPTGATRVRSLFGDKVDHAYIPFETPFSVNRFFAALRPVIALVMETEIWPNLYHGCGSRGIPLVLVSARISPKSVDSYRKLLPLFRETLSHGIVIAAQSRADAERFLSLGAAPERTRVTGNIKFDIEVPAGLDEQGAALRSGTFGNRRVWVAASTHDGEEEQVLRAHEQLLETFPELLLVLVPRHPDRFDAVRELARRREHRVVSRTDERAADEDTTVFLGDTMGEMMLFYAASDIAFVGGSLVPIGGHNLLEPAAVGVPVITGPHGFNAEEIAERFVDEKACRLVDGPDALAGTVAELLRDESAAAELVGNASRILEKNRGALERLLELVRPLI